MKFHSSGSASEIDDGPVIKALGSITSMVRKKQSSATVLLGIIFSFFQHNLNFITEIQ